MATLFNKSLCSCSFSSYGLGLEALNILGQVPSFKIFELFQRGDGAELLFWLDGEQVGIGFEKIQGLNPQGLTEVKIPHSALPKLILNLENSNLQEVLLFFESQSLSEIMIFSDAALKMGWTPVDFRMLRASKAAASVTMTGGSSLVMPNLRELGISGHLTKIDHVSESLREYFDIVPLSQ